MEAIPKKLYINEAILNKSYTIKTLSLVAFGQLQSIW